MNQSALSGAPLPALQIFFRVVELRSFSAVARELGTSQPTVSRQVAALEEHLGVRLLQRSTRRVSPTEAGLAFYERARNAVRALLQAEDDIRTGEQAIRGIVRIAAPGALGRRLVFPAVREVLARHPALSIELHLSDQLVSFTGGMVDFAVRVGVQTEASLVVRRLGLSSQVFVASKAYARKHGRPAKLKDLTGHAMVLRTERGPIATVFEQLSRLGARIVLSADDIEAVYQAVSEGLGVGVLPRWLVSSGVENGSLVACVADAPKICAPVSLVRPAAGWLPQRARLLFDAVAASVAAQFQRIGEAIPEPSSTPA